MNLKPIAAAVVLLSGLSAASAAELVVDQYTLTYDETTDFAWLSSWFGGGSNVGFNWTVPDSATVASLATFVPSFEPAPTVTKFVTLPSFTVTAQPGWALSDLKGFLGNLSFSEVGGATTGILGYATVVVDGGSPVVIDGAGMGWTPQGSGPGYLNGYFSDTYTAPGSFHSFTVSDAFLVLSASGGVYSSIAANNQNKLEISFTAVLVPEPETYAMLLAGLGALGWLAKRRGQS